ncbi:MAG: GDP-mannose 4,6-dehydratase [Acidimicrobiales bacterium]
MKVLVSGGAGFIGSHLVERLIDEGHHVDVLDDLSTGSLANLAEARAGRTGRLTIHQLDVRDAGVGDLVERRAPQVVFHLAAHDDGAGSVDRAVLDAQVNVVGTLNVLDGARRAGAAKVIVTATATTLYAVPTAADLPVRERHEHRPATPHGVAEKAVIDYLTAFRDSHALEFVALVVANVYGPRQRTGVVASLVDQALAGEPCTVHGAGDQTRDLVYVDDVVDALIRSTDRGSGLVANVGSGEETSVNQVVEAVARSIGRSLEVVARPRRPGDLDRYVLDPGRARIHLGWTPWTSLADGVARMVASRSEG